MSNKWNRKLRPPNPRFLVGDLYEYGAREIGESCPLCKGELVRVWGRFGWFIGCSNFPLCRYTRSIDESYEEKKAKHREKLTKFDFQVTVKDIDDSGKQYKYIITDIAKLSPDQASASGVLRISRESPVGMALIAHKEGDEVAVKVPKGTRRLKIMKKEKLKP